MLLWRAQLRFLLRARWSLAVVLLGLTLGIASLVAVHLLTQVLLENLEQGIPVHLRQASHTLTGDGLTTDDYFALRQAWRQGELPSVTGLAPLVQGTTLIDGERYDVLGLDWLALLEPGLSASTSVLAGAGSDGGTRLPLLDRVYLGGSARQPPGFELPSRSGPLTVVGRMDGRSDGRALQTGSAFLYVDIGTAQRLLGRSATALDHVVLFGADPLAAQRRWLNRLLPGLEAGLPAATAPALPVGLSGRLTVLPLRSQLPEQAFGRAVLFNLAALSLLALLVAWFLQYQTAVLWLRRQWPVYRLLLLQGVDPAVLGWLFGSCLVVLGLLAGLLGLVAGVVLAELLAADGLGSEVVSGTLRPSGWLLGKAMLSAAAVPALAAWLSWRRRLTERGDDAMPPEQTAGRQGLLLLLLLVPAVLLLRAEASGLFGAFAAILLLCLLAAMLVAPLLALLRRFFFAGPGAGLLAGALTVLLGVRELLRYPRDLSAALAALILAVATSVGIATMVDSFRADFRAMLSQRLDAPVQLEGTATVLAEAVNGLNTAAEFQSWRGRLSVSPRYRTRLLLEGRPVEVLLRPFDERLRRTYGLSRVPPPSTVLINERAARTLSLATGSTLQLLGERYRVAAVYPGYGDPGLRIVAPLAALKPKAVGGPVLAPTVRLAGKADAVLDQVLLYPGKTGDGEPPAGAAVDEAATASLLSALRSAFPALSVAERQSLRSRALRVFDQTFAITGSLTTLALGVASVGLYGALVAIGLLQVRTQRLLLLLGQSRLDRWSWLLGRSLAVTAFALLLALPLGLVLAALLCGVVNPRGFGWTVPLRWSSAAVLGPALATLVAAILASLMSARRAPVA